MPFLKARTVNWTSVGPDWNRTLSQLELHWWMGGDRSNWKPSALPARQPARRQPRCAPAAPAPAAGAESRRISSWNGTLEASKAAVKMQTLPPPCWRRWKSDNRRCSRGGFAIKVNNQFHLLISNPKRTVQRRFWLGFFRSVSLLPNRFCLPTLLSSACRQLAELGLMLR